MSRAHVRLIPPTPRTRAQESEITHGRVAMLAAAGFLVGESFNPLFDGSIQGLAVNQFQQVSPPPSPFIQW